MTNSPPTKRNALQNIDPYEFEHLVARVWEERGYETTLTRGSSDRGVDIIAKRKQPIPERILIQAKRHGPTSKVGSEDIQKYSGLYQRDEQVDTVVVVTSNEFTSEATSVAQAREVKTVSGSELLDQLESIGTQEAVPGANGEKHGHRMRSKSSSLSDQLSEDRNAASDPWRIKCPFCSASVHYATKSFVHHWALSQNCSFDASSPKNIEVIDESWDTIIKKVNKVKQRHQNTTSEGNNRPMPCPFCRYKLQRSTSAYVDHFLNHCEIDSPEDIPSERPGSIPREIWWDLKDQLEISGLYELKESKSGDNTKESRQSTATESSEKIVSLIEELQIQGSGVHSAKMAENLFRFEDGRDLVGIDQEAERAIYYEIASQSLVSVQFDKHGVYAGKQELLQRELNDPTAWVEAYGSGLVWVHPRYR